MIGRTRRWLTAFAGLFLFSVTPIVGIGAPAAYAAPDLNAGLVGHWAFDGSDGKVAKDLSPRGNDGAIEFGAIRPEKSGASLELDGLGSYVVIREKNPLKLGGAITTALWVKPAALKHRTVLFGIPHSTDSWTTPVFGMSVDSGRIFYGMWLASDYGKKVLVETPEDFPLDAWTFLAATYDGRVARLYRNGALVAEKEEVGRVVRNDEQLYIGKGAGWSKPSFKGHLDDLRIYDRALAAEDVRALYDATKSDYDLTRPVARATKDGTVLVETHGSGPGGDRPWRPQKTRLLELLDGYKPVGDGVKLDRFGGRADRPLQKGTGFFAVTKRDGRHWLVDPEGNAFYHVAVNAVTESRDARSTEGAAERWAEEVTAQLRATGFNGLGNWSSTRLSAVKQPLVWVLRRDFMFAFAREKKLTAPAAGTQGFLNNVMPVFHPDFEAFCDNYGKDLQKTASDPTLLGIMTDNELQCPANLLDRSLALDASNPDLKPGRDAAEAWLKARKGAVNVADITLRDRYEFIAYAFERYYRIVMKAVRKYDPNHLYLGSRLNYHTAQFDNPWLWKAIAPYHDVISVNYYNIWGPDRALLADWEAWGGRPILLTEWYAKAMDAPGLSNEKGAGWLVKTQEDRARYYQHFALNALEIPSIVGWHYFKYRDDPASSTALDSAGGSNKGMVDVDEKPYAPLFERARAVNREVYPLIDFFDARNR